MRATTKANRTNKGNNKCVSIRAHNTTTTKANSANKNYTSKTISY
jgi:hypothetical protein